MFRWGTPIPDPKKDPINEALVRQLIATQFPQWASLPVKAVQFSGWDNRTFHLGSQMLVRLPSGAEYAAQVEKEQYWLPKLAPHLPLLIPAPLAMGEPTKEYPWKWSVYKWIGDNTASIDQIEDMSQFAVELAKFLRALQRIDATNGPVAGEHNFYRGGNLATYDGETRTALEALENKVAAQAITIVWNTALSSVWQRPPVWIHGDIAITNLLMDKGHLSAVIDFGQLGIGDPACDLVIAWTYFDQESREAFRAALAVDSDTWARGRGWALWKALCWAYPGSNCIDWRVVKEILADYQYCTLREQGSANHEGV